MAKPQLKLLSISEFGLHETDTEKQKAKFVIQKRQFDKKLEELANRTAKFYKTFGEKNRYTVLLVSILDMFLQIQDILVFVEPLVIANDIIFSALDLMYALEIDYDFMMDLSMQQPAWKRRWAIRKARRNTRRTVKSIVNRMMSSIRIVVLPVGVYETLRVSIDAMMDKMNGKCAKTRKKTEENEASSMGSGRGLDLVKRKIAEQSDSVTPSVPPTSDSTDFDSTLLL